MLRWRLILESLGHFRRQHAAVGLGVVAATAVLTGALVVGDSMRGSLRRMAFERLGRIEHALVAPRFFRAELADELSAADDYEEGYAAAVPIIVISATMERPKDGAASESRAGGVQLVGCDERFWALGDGGLTTPVSEDSVVLNQTLADELGVDIGDEVLIRIGLPSEIPADSPLGRKTDQFEVLRVAVAEVLPNEGLARFGLSPNQQLPRNAFVSLATAQELTESPDQVNALLVPGKSDGPATGDSAEQINAWLRPKLVDYGLELREVEPRYLQLVSERMLLEDYVAETAERTLDDLTTRSVFTYLANRLSSGDGDVPYSTITAADFDRPPPLGPMKNPDGDVIGRIEPDEIVLNEWAADALGVEPGATITVEYFEPESTHGAVEESSAEFRFKAVAAIDGPAANRKLTPEMKGITDQLSMTAWDPPFPFDGDRITDRDEQYWDDYGTTPKAFIAPVRGRQLWGSRFGSATSIDIMLPEDGSVSRDDVAARLEAALDPSALGLVFRPVKQIALEASKGTTAFEGLFIGFSFFIIASAVLLIVLLFGLTIQQRTNQMGILAAAGWRSAQVRRLLVAEGACVALLAAVAGVAVGVGYGWLMLTGLRTWWLEAIRTPFLQLVVGGRALVFGYVVGVAVSLLAILWSVWRMRGASVRALLAGNVESGGATGVRRPRTRLVAWSMLALAIVLALFAPRISGDAQTGAFFGSGALVLIGVLLLVWCRLGEAALGTVLSRGSGALLGLAMRNAARSPARSGLTLAMVAAASFLIVAISAFRLEPPAESGRRDTGTGGFALLAESTTPVYQDLNRPEALGELGLSAEEISAVEGAEIAAFRVRPGDDASCLNLYQPRRPSVLGVPQRMVDRGGFLWAGTAAETPEERDNPWLLLDREIGAADKGQPVVPLVLDQNTAMFSLHLGGVGSEYRIPDGRGGEIVFEVVGLLKNSIFQGQLLVSETWFKRLFPESSGYRFFLIDTTSQPSGRVAAALETGLGTVGLDVTRTARRLENFFAVQNTYLSTFQSLGGLGLLLGTFGLATVQLRNVFERRGELALLRAAGFARRRLAELVLLENAALLCGGLLIGTLAALVAVGPHWWTGRATLPVVSLSVTMAVVLLVGLAAGWLAVRAMLRAPLIGALRSD